MDKITAGNTPGHEAVGGRSNTAKEIADAFAIKATKSFFNLAEDIHINPETTAQFLKKIGFSDRIIHAAMQAGKFYKKPVSAEKEPEKERPDFDTMIEKGKKYTRDEAIKILMDYHAASQKAILDAFPKLRDENTDQISFRQGEGAARAFIVMEGCKEGEELRSWYSYIRHDGQPQAFRS